VACRYYTLRGLLLLPTGLIFLASGLFDSPPIGDEETSSTFGFFIATLVVAGLGYVVINRYYARRFGRVDVSTRVKARVTVITVLVMVAICVAIVIDSELDLPVCTYGATFAACLLVYYRLLVGLRPYHWVLLGGLTLLNLVPVWGGVDDKISLALIPMGLATMAVGLFDHRDMVRSIEAVRSSTVAGAVDARA
jgi:hypothetical protein